MYTCNNFTDKKNIYMCDLHVLIQVVLTVSQIMWCRDLTECLNKEDDQILEAVQAAEKRCFQVIH